MTRPGAQVDHHLLSHESRHLRVVDQQGSIGYEPGPECFQRPGVAFIACRDEGLPSDLRY
ncbi:MAG: hypothetical protein WB867_10780 [Candidatus Dormiibacterota bacterium]